MARSTKPWASKVTAAKKKTVRAGPRVPMKPDRPARGKKVVEPVIPDTQEDLMAQFGTALAEVDQLMETRTAIHTHISLYDETVKEQVRRLHNLTERLQKLLNPKFKPDLPNVGDAIKAAFGARPGTVPKWSQPGQFIVWIGYVPCLCIWGGFAEATADVVAIDPKQRWMTPSGAISLPSIIIRREHKTVEDLFRAYLTGKTLEAKVEYKGGKPKDAGPWFNLHPLIDVAQESVRNTLAAPGNEWIEGTLKLGPVNAIPLPQHLRAVQVSMFG